MQTQREYLYSLGLAKAATGRGRFSGEAHAALAKARESGMTFADDNKPEPKPVRVKVVGASSKVTIPNPEARKVDPAAVREWAGKNGHKVGARGRIHSDVIEAYLASVPKEEQTAREGEFDPYRPAAPRRYPEGTMFEGTYEYRGKTERMVVSDRSACMVCGVSLKGHLCDTPQVVTGVGSGFMRVTPIYPKG